MDRLSPIWKKGWFDWVEISRVSSQEIKKKSDSKWLMSTWSCVLVSTLRKAGWTVGMKQDLPFPSVLQIMDKIQVSIKLNILPLTLSKWRCFMFLTPGYEGNICFKHFEYWGNIVSFLGNFFVQSVWFLNIYPVSKKRKNT